MTYDFSNIDNEAVAERLQEISNDNFDALTGEQHMIMYEAGYRLRIADIRARYKKRAFWVDAFFFGLLVIIVLVIGLT